MGAVADKQKHGDETRGMALGVLGVVIFSVTLPATRVALVELDPVIVGLGRAVLAGIFAGVILLATRQPWPSRRDIGHLIVVALGVVIGFPLFSAIAMQSVPASHGGVMLGILPLATAACGALVARERPSRGFWLVGCFGSALVAVFASVDAVGGIGTGDLWLVAAVIAAAIGYAWGGVLSRKLGSWQVICWALIISQPVLVPIVLLSVPDFPATLTTSTWVAFLYVALCSQLIGFFAWNRGLAMGGVARVSQTQLLQPFLTIVFAMLLLGEALDAMTLLFAAGIVATVALGRRMPISHKKP